MERLSVSEKPSGFMKPMYRVIYLGNINQILDEFKFA